MNNSQTDPRGSLSLEAPPISRQTMPDTVIDVRRAAVVGSSPLNYYTTLWRTDERELSLTKVGAQVLQPRGVHPGQMLGVLIKVVGLAEIADATIEHNFVYS